jgi:hypothetical protein
MENSYTSYLSFEKFLIAAAAKAMHDAGWSTVEIGVGWQHVEAIGPRNWVYMTQFNGGAEDEREAVLKFTVRVSRRGRVNAKYLGCYPQ